MFSARLNRFALAFNIEHVDGPVAHRSCRGAGRGCAALRPPHCWPKRGGFNIRVARLLIGGQSPFQHGCGHQGTRLRFAPDRSASERPIPRSSARAALIVVKHRRTGLDFIPPMGDDLIVGLPVGGPIPTGPLPGFLPCRYNIHLRDTS